MRKIDVGLLLPSSTILPVAKDFEAGVGDGIKSCLHNGISFNIIPEFIGQGGLKQTEDACNKLLNYNNVDIVTGVISNRVAEAIAEKFRIRKTPLLINNLGGHIPVYAKDNEYVFLNSVHLWQHAYALGQWGVQQFGKRGMFVGSVYDAGYSFSHMFYTGMMAADPTSEWSFSVPPIPPAGSLSDVSVIFPYLEHYQPDFVFAAFCGAETTLFINEFIARGWHKKTTLTGLPFLLSPFSPINASIKIYTTLPFENRSIPAEKSFYHLGCSTGVAIAEASLKSNHSTLHQQLLLTRKLSGSKAATIAIRENEIIEGHDQFYQQHLYYNNTYNEDLDDLVASMPVGWLNPYLCI